jgi:hypothetical protein
VREFQRRVDFGAQAFECDARLRELGAQHLDDDVAIAHRIERTPGLAERPRAQSFAHDVARRQLLSARKLQHE